jgi:hypothetical protein
MKKHISTYFYRIILIVTIQIISVRAHSQKLPNKQEASVRSPTDVKVDGKSMEWEYQAYNKATGLYYTIANDDDKLYLSIHADDPQIIQRIISAGISFTITSKVQKKKSDGMTVTYPKFNKKSNPNIDLKSNHVNGLSKEEIERITDSLIIVNNKKIISNSKDIMIKGVKELDTLISIYNVDGVNATSLFDNKMSYNYELSIDLKYIRPFLINQLFIYNIKINEVTINNLNGLTVTTAPDGLPVFNFSKGVVIPSLSAAQSTDFGGEYTLAKKP